MGKEVGRWKKNTEILKLEDWIRMYKKVMFGGGAWVFALTVGRW